MIFFYLLVSVMPMVRHPLWSDFIGDLTMVKWVGVLSLAFALMYAPYRRATPMFFATTQGRLFLVLAVLGILSSTLRTIDLPFELSPATSYISFVIFFLVAIVLIDSIDRLRWTIFVALASVAYASIHTLREWQTYGGMTFGYRPGWVTGDPNYFSVSALLCLPLAFYLLKCVRTPTERWFCRATIGVTLPAVMLAASRGAFLGLVAGLGLMACRSQRPLRNLVFGFVIFLPVAAVIPASPLERLLHPDQSDQASTDIRTAHLEAGLRMFQQHWLAGVGPGNFKPLISVFDIGDFEAHIAHNTYLEMAAELGAPGLLLFVATLVATFISLERVRRKARQTGPAVICASAEGIQVGLVAFAVAAFFLSAQYQKLLWLLVFVSTTFPSFLPPKTRPDGPVRARTAPGEVRI